MERGVKTIEFVCAAAVPFGGNSLFLSVQVDVWMIFGPIVRTDGGGVRAHGLILLLMLLLEGLECSSKAGRQNTLSV